MKYIKYLTGLFFSFAFLVSGQVGINTTNVEDGVMLQIDAPSKGVLFPRVALISVTSTSPLPTGIPTGTIVYNTSIGKLYEILIPGLYWWSAEENKWTNILYNINDIDAVVKYTNSEQGTSRTTIGAATNYNASNSWQTIKIFGNKIIDSQPGIYTVDTLNNTVTINKDGIYNINGLITLLRSTAGAPMRIALSSQVFVNGQPKGTETVTAPGYSLLANDSDAYLRGLFTISFKEYLALKEGDVVEIKIRKTPGTYTGTNGNSPAYFFKSGNAAITINSISYIDLN